MLKWAALLTVLLTAGLSNAAESMFYIGTYTGGDSKGIYVSRLNLETGAMTPAKLAAEIDNPSFLAIHPNGKTIYAVNEVSNYQGEKSGSVSAFAVTGNGEQLRFLNRQPSGGGGPCHVIVDRAGKHVLAANYGGGSVIALPVKSDGGLGERTSFIQHTGRGTTPRQSQPFGHSVNLDRENKFAIVADLGIDKLMVYRFDSATGKLTANEPASISMKAGAGPRHFAFGKEPSAFVINEMDSTLTSMTYDPAKGAFTIVETVSTLPANFTNNNSTAEVRVHPSGKFVYGSNRGHNSIAVFAYDAATKKLKLVEHESTQGRTPRNFNLDPSGKFLLAANQDSNTIFSFKVDENTGALTPTGHKIEVGKPVCIRFPGGGQ